nr:MAG TPA: hypothetical protein [Caudoviricetes sp.]
MPRLQVITFLFLPLFSFGFGLKCPSSLQIRGVFLCPKTGVTNTKKTPLPKYT